MLSAWYDNPGVGAVLQVIASSGSVGNTGCG
jgi:hypothetical protein